MILTVSQTWFYNQFLSKEENWNKDYLLQLINCLYCLLLWILKNLVNFHIYVINYYLAKVSHFFENITKLLAIFQPMSCSVKMYEPSYFWSMLQPVLTSLFIEMLISSLSYILFYTLKFYKIFVKIWFSFEKNTIFDFKS